MNEPTVRSLCECQASLGAACDAEGRVRGGWAEKHGARLRSPAHAIGAGGERFDVAWLCPFCGRNTLRTFCSERVGARPA